MRWLCGFLGIVLARSAFAIAPAYFGIEGYVDDVRYFASGTIDEHSVRAYFTTNFAGIYISAQPHSDGRINLLMGGRYGVVRYVYDFQGQTSPWHIGNDSAFGGHSSISNATFFWSEDAGLFTRVANATRFPMVLADGGTSIAIPSGTGVCASLREYIAEATVDTTGEQYVPYFRWRHLDTGGSYTSGPSMQIQNWSEVNNKRFGRWVVDEVAYPPVGAVPLFADIYASSGGLLHSVTGAVVHSNHVRLTNAVVWTEWRFDDTAVFLPRALINGIVVCGSHTSNHLVEHEIPAVGNPDAHYDHATKTYTFVYTMSLDSYESGRESEPCVFRTWSGAETYEEADPGKRAEFSGTVSSVPSFTAKYHLYSCTWEIMNTQ